MYSINLQDETFPEDDLFSLPSESNLDNIDIESVTVGINISSTYEPSLLSLNGNDDDPSSGQVSTTSSGLSSQGKFSDESKETTSNNDATNKPGSQNSVLELSRVTSYSKKKTYEKSQSYQDLHSDYTKKKFQHVKSKVQEYVANIKAQDRRRREKKSIGRHNSLPDTINRSNNKELVENVANSVPHLSKNVHSTNKVTDCTGSPLDDETAKILSEKDHQINELKRLNEYLQSNISDKMALAARYKRNADNLQIDLMKLKEREIYNKQNSSLLCNRSSLPSSYLLFSCGKAVASTQTDSQFVNCTIGNAVGGNLMR